MEEYIARNLFIPTLTTDDLDVDVERCGLHGSPTKVHKIDSVILGGGGRVKVNPTKEGMDALVERLMEDRIFG